MNPHLLLMVAGIGEGEQLWLFRGPTSERPSSGHLALHSWWRRLSSSFSSWRHWGRLACHQRPSANHNCCVVESVLTIAVWYGSSIITRRTRLRRMVKPPNTLLTSLHSTNSRVHRRAASIIKDHFTLLPPGRTSRSLTCWTSRHRNSFFPLLSAAVAADRSLQQWPH